MTVYRFVLPVREGPLDAPKIEIESIGRELAVEGPYYGLEFSITAGYPPFDPRYPHEKITHSATVHAAAGLGALGFAASSLVRETLERMLQVREEGWYRAWEGIDEALGRAARADRELRDAGAKVNELEKLVADYRTRLLELAKEAGYPVPEEVLGE